MRIVDGALHLRSHGAALRYLGDYAPALTDAEGFVDTGDLVERHDDRYYFVGRANGLRANRILKQHPA